MELSKLGIALMVIKVSVWAGLTEEIIFRGMLISILRRWQAFNKQLHRDLFAVIVSAAVFGLSHIFVWGPVMALVLFGLGLGFGVAYIAIGELLLPVVVYHIGFDILSIGASIWLSIGN